MTPKTRTKTSKTTESTESTKKISIRPPVLPLASKTRTTTTMNSNKTKKTYKFVLCPSYLLSRLQWQGLYFYMCALIKQGLGP